MLAADIERAPHSEDGSVADDIMKRRGSYSAEAMRLTIETELGSDTAVQRLPTDAPRRIPRTSVSRLEQATPACCPEYPVRTRHILSSKPDQGKAWEDPSSTTVLYLAYGSNMAAATFERTRDIRPLSSVSVSAPTLELTFDLPGLPYREPCFANTAVRRRMPQIPGVPDLPDKPPKLPPGLAPPAGVADLGAGTNSRGDPIWTGGLYGVVYEVTREDFAHIIATEGGGAAYQDILVPCFALPPAVSIPEKPALPEPPRPFLAHTLWAPQVPDEDEDGDGSDDNDGDDGDDDDGDGWLSRQWRRVRRRLLRIAITRPRPDPAYAQPSGRYLGLLVDGAREHELPAAYQSWLASLAPYRATTCRQHFGAAVLLVAGLPVLLFLGFQMKCRPRRPGRSGSGRLPLWVLVLTGLFARGMWWAYDKLMRPVFGDGERTEETDSTGAWTDNDTYKDDEATPLRANERA